MCVRVLLLTNPTSYFSRTKANQSSSAKSCKIHMPIRIPSLLFVFPIRWKRKSSEVTNPTDPQLDVFLQLLLASSRASASSMGTRKLFSLYLSLAAVPTTSSAFMEAWSCGTHADHSCAMWEC